MSTDARIIGYCRMCGKALEEHEALATEGTLYCAEHAPQAQASSEVPAGDGSSSPAQPPPLYTAPPFHSASPYAASQPPPLPKADQSVSPALAFVLGFIPGVGAVYNGQ